MNKIEINPHDCTIERFEALKAYLNDKCWDWQEVSNGTSETEETEGHRTIEVLQHTIEYWFYNDDKYVDGVCLDDMNEEHIKNMIIEGYNQGELCSYGQNNDETEERGWWKIVR